MSATTLADLDAAGGMLSRHMLAHILLMNVLAPAIAWPLAQRPGNIARAAGRIDVLLVAAVTQLCLLIAWHSPGGLAFGMATPLHALAMQASLFAAALVFWTGIFAQAGSALWRSLVVLLVTGKTYCLFAALLVFAPRVLYPRTLFPDAMAVTLADQHFAGVMMVVACPLSYVLVAMILTGRWFAALGEAGARGN